MELKPVDALVADYKEAYLHYVKLLALAVASLPPSIARQYKLPVITDEIRQQRKTEYQRLGGEEEFKRAERRRQDLRQEISHRLAQEGERDAAFDRYLETIDEFIDVKKRTPHGVKDLGKLPRCDGKTTRTLLQRWFGPGSYELDPVRDSDHEGPVLVDV